MTNNDIWEYRAVSINMFETQILSTSIQDELNKYGLAGWELVQVYPQGTTYGLAIFKIKIN